MNSTINIFCIMGRTGAGKSSYFNKIVSNKLFMKVSNLSLLVFGTTKKKKPEDKEGIDYYFYSNEEYEKLIKDDDLIECRSYYTLNHGVVKYFTKASYIESKNTNIICTVSPYQFESYKNWCNKQNIKTPGRYKLFLIIIDTSLRYRLNRIITESDNSESELYELCRRILEEKSEFESVTNRLPELIDPMGSSNVCYVNNDSSSIEVFKQNLEIIKRFIVNNIK